MMDVQKQRTRKASAGVPRPILRKCFICGQSRFSPDKEPPFRCGECYEAVRANEADGEL